VTASYTKTGSWSVSGLITVANPNNWEAITGVTVTDSIDNNGICSVTGGTNVTVAKSGQVQLPYTCSYTAVPSPTIGRNTATATWTATTFFTPDGTKNGTQGYNFSPLTTGFTTVTITDAFNGGSATTLGVINALTNAVSSVGSGVTVTKTPPSFKFTYSHVVNVPIGTCSSINNTATIVETTQKANASVTVCNTKTGALTMGFWQGPQGQKVITTSGLSGPNCATVITYLTGYSPFSDLGATTCAKLNSYISGVVNTANSSGGGGLMLKGQMLATALTSFYSQLPNPLSGQGTTPNFGNIWILLDPIKGTEDVRSAFISYNKVAPHLWGEQVLQMLADASANWTASQCSTSTGACKVNPYSNKTIMVYGSDAFAYINQGQANISAP
jgi:hypothetical protein